MCQAEDGKRPMVWLAELDTLKLSNLHVRRAFDSGDLRQSLDRLLFLRRNSGYECRKVSSHSSCQFQKYLRIWVIVQNNWERTEESASFTGTFRFIRSTRKT